MRRALLTTALLGMAALALPPAAQAGPFYLFAKLGSTDTAIDVAGGFTDVLDGDDNSNGFGLGFKLGRHWAFQAEYHDLGKVPGFGLACAFEEPTCVPGLPVEADSSAVSVTVVPHVLLTRRIRLYGKLGYISWDTDISAVRDQGSEFLEQFSDEDLVYGAGLRLEIPGPIDAFAEYERIADAFDTVAIGATWGF
jgi:hypothetical protein